MSPDWLGWFYGGSYGVVIVILFVTLTARLLNELGIIDLDETHWKRIAKKFGFSYTGKDQSGTIGITGSYRGRPVCFTVYSKRVRFGRRIMEQSAYQIEIGLAHKSIEFVHQPPLYRGEISLALPIYDFVAALKQESSGLYLLTLRHPPIFDSLLALRGYEMLSINNSVLTYKNTDIHRGRFGLRDLKSIFNHIADFADAVEMTN
jgi:hypothetical protein